MTQVRIFLLFLSITMASFIQSMNYISAAFVSAALLARHAYESAKITNYQFKNSNNIQETKSKFPKLRLQSIVSYPIKDVNHQSTNVPTIALVGFTALFGGLSFLKGESINPNITLLGAAKIICASSCALFLYNAYQSISTNQIHSNFGKNYWHIRIKNWFSFELFLNMRHIFQMPRWISQEQSSSSNGKCSKSGQKQYFLNKESFLWASLSATTGLYWYLTKRSS